MYRLSLHLFCIVCKLDFAKQVCKQLNPQSLLCLLLDSEGQLSRLRGGKRMLTSSKGTFVGGLVSTLTPLKLKVNA